MDFGDFLNATGTEGSRRLRIITGTIGALLGGGIGTLSGFAIGEASFAPVTHGIIGAVAGGGLGALFSGYVLFGLILVVVFGIAFAWKFFVEGA